MRTCNNLWSTLLPKIQSTGAWNHYDRFLMRGSVYISLFELFFFKFVPDTVWWHWNSLNLDVRNETSVSKIKMVTCISWFLQHRESFIFFLVFMPSKCQKNIIHTKLRYDCILHYDLYKINITESGNCLCGLPEYVYCVFVGVDVWASVLYISGKKNNNTNNSWYKSSFLSYEDIVVITICNY